MTKNIKSKRTFKKYIRETWKNKALALVLFLASLLPAMYFGDWTATILLAVIYVPLFIAKKNCINTFDEDDVD